MSFTVRTSEIVRNRWNFVQNVIDKLKELPLCESRVKMDFR